jgi:hypothetical protein
MSDKELSKSRFNIELMKKVEANKKEKIFELIENYRKKKPSSKTRNEACDTAISVIKGLNLNPTERMYKTLEQDILEIFTKRNIEVLSEEVGWDKKDKCFVWKIKGRNKK